ncbi:DUF4239 domain-containing protein [Amycolatopsis anabasis]|uniref:bestrophin-like domain n=1 Tax=Amycolatopsis anabasis TaxID=1840409 RepID=UPI00131D3403|nr:DUF4239 domain-containing protein [Amycolatopsis anabasis]
MSIFLSGLLWVFGAVVVGAVVGYLVRRFGLDEGRPGNNDAAGQVFTIVGGLNAVVIAFVLVSLYDGVSAAQDGSYKEANSLVAATWAADSLPEPTRAQAREISRAYATTVAEQEWPQLRSGEQVAGPGWQHLDQLRDVVEQAQLSDDAQGWMADQKKEAMTQLAELYQARQARLTEANDPGIGTVVWCVLVLGSVITVLLPNLFGGTKMVTHVIIVSTLAGTLALLLFGIYQLQNPYTGGAKVEPDAFKWALERLR